MPNALVIRAAGTNCDAELARAFTLAGAETTTMHLERLAQDPAVLDRFDLFGFPGGFSYGDDIASGRIFAMKARERLYPALRAAVLRGCPIIGVCNGFQVLVQLGLLPGPDAEHDWPEDAPPRQCVALTDNQDARFHDRWVGVEYLPNSICLWTRGLAADTGPGAGPASADEDLARQQIEILPVAHGEGRFVTGEPALLGRLEQRGQVALRYRTNFNGSEGAVAGICDATGQVFGLMPHPERYLDWNRHPFWTRLDPSVREGETPGLRIFKNAVEAATRTHAAG